jgi:hypothetical protein
LSTVAATSLPHWILGNYVIGVGARTAWWGRARPLEGRARMPEGRARLPEGRARLHEGRAQLPEGRARLPDGRAWPRQYKTMSPKTGEKCDKRRVSGQNKLFSENPALLPLGSFHHMAACRSSLENT